MILLDRVTKTYVGDKLPALDHVSLHIEPNEFVFLVGKSGAGKSTLIKMITKEETPDSGKIIIGGIDLDYVKKRYIPHYRRRLGVVFQDFKLLPARTVYENVAFALEIAGMSNSEIEKTVPKVLDLVGLLDKAKKFPRHLSGGERQRVAIARSVARQPKILIADEPTGNLDPVTKREIIDLLQRINDFGTTVLVTTHDSNVVNNLGKRVITLKDGQIVSDQKVNGVYRLNELDPETPTEAPRILTPEELRRNSVPEAAPRVAKKLARGTGDVANAGDVAKSEASGVLAKAPSKRSTSNRRQKSTRIADTISEEPLVSPTYERPPRRPAVSTKAPRQVPQGIVVDAADLKPVPTLKPSPKRFRSTRKVL